MFDTTSVEKTAGFFHSVETFFPLCGKIADFFSIVWKIWPFFSTVWKSFFHSVENFAAGNGPRVPAGGG